MSAPEPYTLRLTTVEATLRAERLLAEFDDQEPTFIASFIAADRDIFGAMIAYASGAIREVAARDECELADVRRALRLRVSQIQAGIDQKKGTNS